MVAINSAKPNYDFTSLIAESAKDGRIDNSEAKQIKQFINRTNLPSSDKKELANFVDKLSKETSAVLDDDFLKKYGGEKNITQILSPEHISQLEKMFDKNGVAALMLSVVKESQNAFKTGTEVNVNNFAASPFEPSQTKFNTMTRNTNPSQAQAVAQTSSVNQSTGINLKADFLRNQYATNFNSKNGDCGPTVAIMLLRANGSNVDMDDIPRLRQESGAAPATSKGSVAATFANIKSMIEKESKEIGGGVQITGGKVSSFKKTEADRAKLLEHLQNELSQGKMPILCTGLTPMQFVDPETLAHHKQQTGKDYKAGTGRHYTLVLGVSAEGVKVADPSGGNIRTYSMEELMARMKGCASPTEVMSFTRN